MGFLGIGGMQKKLYKEGGGGIEGTGQENSRKLKGCGGPTLNRNAMRKSASASEDRSEGTRRRLLLFRGNERHVKRKPEKMVVLITRGKETGGTGSPVLQGENARRKLYGKGAKRNILWV